MNRFMFLQNLRNYISDLIVKSKLLEIFHDLRDTNLKKKYERQLLYRTDMNTI